VFEINFDAVIKSPEEAGIMEVCKNDHNVCFRKD